MYELLSVLITLTNYVYSRKIDIIIFSITVKSIVQTERSKLNEIIINKLCGGESFTRNTFT